MYLSFLTIIHVGLNFFQYVLLEVLTLSKHKEYKGGLRKNYKHKQDKEGKECESGSPKNRDSLQLLAFSCMRLYSFLLSFYLEISMLLKVRKECNSLGSNRAQISQCERDNWFVLRLRPRII